MPSPVREGEILAGKYRVERVLGEGGMGVVVAARHVELDELVALKFLLPEVLGVPEAVGRFLREARAAVRIKSEHVARVTDVGQLETGAPYMVMEYLEGNDLGQILTARGALPVEQVIDYVAQACEAIAEAHAIGIVHRDLKPSNLMLVRRSDGTDCVKLLDFGISKVSTADEGAMAMTRTSTMLGSPLYMSPEQMMSARDVDGRSDIWALGTILYELITGEPPFVADSLPALGVLIATVPAEPMRNKRRDIPPGLDAIALRCLAKKREDRFATVGELAAALGPFAPERSQASIRRATRILEASRAAAGKGTKPGYLVEPPVEAATVNRGAATASNWGQTASATSNKRLALVGLGAAVMVVMVILALVLRRGSDAHGTVASAAQAAPEQNHATPSSDAPQAPVAPPAIAEAVPKVVEAVPVLPAPTSDLGNVAAAPSNTAEMSPHPPTHPRALAVASPTHGAKPAPARPKKTAYDDM